MNSRKNLCRLAAELGGLPVLACQADSPAARAGVVYGDIVLSVNGWPTPTWSAFVQARSHDPAWMELELFRDGEELTIVVSLDTNAEPSSAELN